MTSFRVVPALLAFASLCSAQPGREPHTFLRDYAKFSDKEIALVESGKPVAKILNSPSADTIYVGGAIYINASPEDYIKFAKDIDRLKGLSQYLAVGRFSETPTLADLNGFALEPEDIKKLRDCRPGKCEVQLPTDAMAQFRASVDWSKPDVESQVNAAARQMALEALRRYREGGNRALGAYHDKEGAVDISTQFQSLVGSREAVGDYMPNLNRYLREYPAFRLPRAESVFFWERVNFGLKPTLRINHLVTYRENDTRGTADVVAVKQLYASHYFQVALDLSACIRDSANPQKPGFFLVTLKGSKQAGLTGFTGSILRKVVVDKTRSSQELALAGIKALLEKGR